MVPKETDAVFMVNVKQARKSPLWDKFVEKFNQDPKSKADYDEVVKKCQIDPLKQLDSLFIAVPSNVTESKEFALILRGGLSLIHISFGTHAGGFRRQDQRFTRQSEGFAYQPRSVE